MAVVTKYTAAVMDPTTLLPPKGIAADAVTRRKRGSISVANGDSATSVFHICDIPSDAVILPDSTLYHTAVSGLTDLDIGFSEPAAAAADNLADGLNVSSAGTKSVVASVAVADLHKPAWQIAGFTTQPSPRQLRLIATMKADAGAAGTLHFDIGYVV